MRIRQVKPSYYLDKTLWTRLRADQREFYIALWLIADDAGWFEWDTSSIAAEVYRFVGVTKRERDVEAFASAIENLEPSAPHLIRHACGHAEVPKMPQHQRLSGPTRRVTTIWDAHKDVCLSPYRRSPRGPAENRGERVDENVNSASNQPSKEAISADPRGAPRIPADARPVGNGIGRERNGKGSARERETTTGGLVDRLGPWETVIGGKVQ